MTTTHINNLIADYYTWLKDQTYAHTDSRSGWHVISTPFLGSFNDNIEIYAKFDGDKIILSDDGVTLSNLDLLGAGVAYSTKRKELMEMILLNYGIELKENELTVVGSKGDFSQKKFNLISAICDLSDLEFTAKHTVASIFREDVRKFFDEQSIIYTPQFIAKGSTGIDFTFDFQIAGRQQELVIKTFNSLNKSNVPAFLFGWDDIKGAREKASGKELNGMAIINDGDNIIKEDFVAALQSKGAKVILFSKRYYPENISQLKLAA